MFVREVDEYIEYLESQNKQLKLDLKILKDSMKHCHPTRLIHTKSRGNTTIIFHDGSSETVHLKEGEKDCLDTAVAYALMKHSYPKDIIRKLIKRVEEK